MEQPLPLILNAATSAGLDTTDAVLVHHYGSAVAILPQANAVVRLTTGTRQICERVAATQNICAELNTHAPIATEPLDIDPIALNTTTVTTFWTYYPQQRPAVADAEALGELLRRLHATQVPTGLPDWLPLAALESAISSAGDILDHREHAWLVEAIDCTRYEISQLESRLGRGMIHGDAWLGNTLRHAGGSILCDWDDVGIGPREIDLVAIWHSVRRYRAPRTRIRQLVDGYGADLSDWPGLEPLLRMRDLMQLAGPLHRAHRSPHHKSLLTQRLGDIISGNHTTTWNV